MARDFFPFVEENGEAQDNPDQVVTYPARIAVYEDPSVTPRVVIIEPTNVRDFLANITETVSKLARELGGTIPFTIIRELVENFIHASFIEPTITILDGGETIRFCDQGPGIREKDQALQFGTTSATEDMKHYIRGVGSGLPIAQQYMIDKGGSLTIQDNINGGTIVTISTRPSDEADAQLSPHVEGTASSFAGQQAPVMQTNNGFVPTMTQQQGQVQPQPVGAGAWGYQAQPQANPYHAGGWQQIPQQQGQMQPQPQWNPQVGYARMSQMPQQPANAAMMSDMAPSPSTTFPTTDMPTTPATPNVSERGGMILSYLAQNEVVGPNDLVRTFGLSSPTWSRALDELDKMGLTRKDGQKRRLTEMGISYLANLG